MRILKNKNLLVVTIFFFSISVVTLGMVFNLDRLPQNNENRILAKFPPFKFEIEVLRAFPEGYTNYYNDHFGFRNTFVVINFLIRHNILHESPSEQVVLGKNGWLFYTNDRSIEDYRGITHFDDNTLRYIGSTYEFKMKYLLGLGIKYILVFAPNKSTVYGEWMPDYLYKIRDRSGLDELIDYLKNNTNVDIIDLRETLFDNKTREQLFLKTSSSWNEYAAFLAYRDIMKHVSRSFPATQANSLMEFSIKRQEIRGGELAEMMGGADFFREKDILLVPKYTKKAQKVDFNPSGTHRDPFSMKQENNDFPRVIVFRDCFFDKVIPFLSENFEYSRYYWQSWNPDTPITEMINTVRPDIVIEEKVERFIKLQKSP